MCEFLNKLNVFNKISENIKNEIKFFHVFNDYKYNEKNVLFVTKDDKVFAFGNNSKGVLGFGHNKKVKVPEEVLKDEEIEELRNKKIKQFFTDGFDFVLAQSSDNKLFAWGKNYHGQLGRGFKSGRNEYLKPKEIVFKKGISEIQQICSSGSQTMVLFKDKRVYVWGNNRFGYFGKENDKHIVEPKLLKFQNDLKVKSIYFYYWRYLIISEENKIFSWGFNGDNNLGHMNDEENIMSPRLIQSLSNIDIIDVKCWSSYLCFITYFLSFDGRIYFCGEYHENGEKKKQIEPKLLGFNTKFIRLERINKTIFALSDNNIVFEFREINCEKTKYKLFEEYSSEKLQITYQTLDTKPKTEFKKRNADEYSEIATKKMKYDISSVDISMNELLNELCTKMFICTKNYEESEKSNEFKCFSDFLKKHPFENGIVKYYYICKENMTFNYFGYIIDHVNRLWFIGDNSSGHVGKIDKDIIEEYVQIHFPKNLTPIIRNIYHGITCMYALTGNYDTIYAWGSNKTYLLGSRINCGSDEISFPIEILKLNEKITDIQIGIEHVLAITESGKIYGWGRNNHRQIFKEKINQKIISPKLLDFFHPNFVFLSIYAFNYCSFAINSDGKLFIWGEDEWGIQQETKTNYPFEFGEKIQFVCCTDDYFFYIKENIIYQFKNGQEIRIFQNSLIYSIVSFDDFVIFKTDEGVYRIFKNNVMKTLHESFNDYFWNELGFSFELEAFKNS